MPAVITRGFICLVFLFSMVLSGCSSQTSTPGGGGDSAPSAGKEDTGAKATVRFAMGDGEITKEQIASFEKEHPNIKIERVDSDYNKLMAMIAAGNAPDIIRVQGATELPSYVIKGIAMDLTPYFEKSTVFKSEDFLPIVNAYKFDGKTQGVGPIYGFPKDWSQDFTLFYNKKLFDEAGIPYPSPTEPMTWKELLDLSKKLTKVQNKKVVQYGLGYYNDGTKATQELLMLPLAQQGKNIYSSDFSKADLTTPEAKEVLNMWVDAVKANIGPNPVNQEPAWSGDLFIQDKVAMEMIGYWFSGMLRGNEKTKERLKDFGVAPAPVMENGDRMSPTGAVVGGIIYRKTKVPDAAWQVFEWFFGGKPVDDRAKSGWGLPAFKSKLELMPQNSDWDQEVLKFQQEELKYGDKFLQFNPYVNLEAVKGLFDKYFTPVYFNKDTVDGAAKKITDELNNLIGEGRDIAGVN